MYCKQHAVQVMAHAYLASPASEARAFIECWGKCWGKMCGESTLLVKRPLEKRSAAQRSPQDLNHFKRISGYRTGKSCEHAHVVKAGPVQSLHAVVCSCLQTRLKHATSYSNALGDATKKQLGDIANDVDLT